jgi:hypothetical protein
MMYTGVYMYSSTAITYVIDSVSVIHYRLFYACMLRTDI